MWVLLRTGQPERLCKELCALKRAGVCALPHRLRAGCVDQRTDKRLLKI
jgi:hypothetical protein